MSTLLQPREDAVHVDVCTELISNHHSPRRGEVCGRGLPCPVHSMRADQMPSSVLAGLFDRLIAERNDLTGNGGIDELGLEISAGLKQSADGALRMIRRIQSGDTRNVTIDQVDRLLVALDLVDLWFTDPTLQPYNGVGDLDTLDEPAERPVTVINLKMIVEPCLGCGAETTWERGDSSVRTPRGCWHSLCYAQNTGTGFGPFSRKELLALYTRYVREGVSPKVIAKKYWKLRGYKSPNACASSLNQGWRRNGWPIRRTGETLRLNRQRNGPRLSKHRKLSEADARELHPAHWDGWVSINQIAKDNCERLGMTQGALGTELGHTWKLLGLPRHSRIEMTVHVSTKNGLSPRDDKERRRRRHEAGLNVHSGKPLQPDCDAVNAAGERCQSKARYGHTTCWSHDPANRERIVEHVGQMRLRSPKQNPRMIEPVQPLQAEMRAYFAWAGTWQQLADRTGITADNLSKLSRSKQQERVRKMVARRIRAGIADLTVDDVLEDVA